MYKKVLASFLVSILCPNKLGINRIMKNALYILFGLNMAQVSAQNYPMTTNGQTYYTCSGVFTDNGGANSNYAGNITDRTMTFCPTDSNQSLRFEFVEFDVEFYGSIYWDYLEVYFGNTAVGAADMILVGDLDPFVIESQAVGECITFKFTSDGSVTREGWIANISCFVPCSLPLASFNVEGENLSELELCTGDLSDLSVNFDASSSTSTDSNVINQYIWNWGDGTSTTTSSSTITHSFPNEAGFYNVNLNVKTFNLSTEIEECTSTNEASLLVKVVPPPTFEGSSPDSIEISCGDGISLTGVASSQTIVEELPPGTGSSAALPDTTNMPFESSIDLTGYFPAGSKVRASCLPKVTLNLEHSWAADLQIYLIAPSGQQIYLFNGYGDYRIGNEFFGYCVKGSEGTGPGCPAPYHIQQDGLYNWFNNNALTGITQTCSGYAGPCQSGDYFKQNQTYKPYQAFTNLIGADLNGVWTLRIIDNMGLDDGHLESWSLSFPTDCYSGQEILTPNLSDAVWTSSGGGPNVPLTQTTTDEVHTTTGVDDCPSGMTCVGNRLTNTVDIGPFNAAGNYIYTYQVTDEFGCVYSHEVEVVVLEGEELEMPDLQVSYCENEEADALPTISNNNVTGVWSPATIDTSIVGQTTYTFTPDACSQPFELIVTVEEGPALSEINFDY